MQRIPESVALDKLNCRFNLISDPEQFGEDFRRQGFSLRLRKHAKGFFFRMVQILAVIDGKLAQPEF